jgi:hypothetical protein
MLDRWHCKRFVYPSGTEVTLDQGYLPDPENWRDGLQNRAVLPFDDLANKRCVVLLGEPGLGQRPDADLPDRSTEALLDRVE